MNTDLSPRRCGNHAPQRHAPTVLLACATFFLLPTPAAVAAPNAASATGIITGIVTNKTTGNGLEGARVDLPQLGPTTLVDTTGRYIMLSRELVNLGFEYYISGNHKLTLDIANLCNAPQRYYRSIPDQMQNFLMQGTKITMGIQGQF